MSGGRLRFGVAVGGAPEDYAVSGVPWSGRGRRLESMLGEIQRVWEHAPRDDGVSVGPDVSGDPPPILLGGAADVTFKRAARYGDGWIMAAGPAAAFSEGREKLRAAFRQAGRQTAPLAMAGGFFALGTDAGEVARRNLGEYFVVDPHLGELTLDGTFTTGAELREQLGEFERRGCDHFILFPASAGAEQVDLLADEVASWLTPTRSAA